jgi:predicted naringenin-chalcone synthase
VHSELCTLHLDPSNHSPEQLVVQSLFADGLISYQVGSKPKSMENVLEVLAVKEELLPDSKDAMSWAIEPHGFVMTLSRKVPELIGGHIEGFLERMFLRAGLEYAAEKETAIFAIHPGGPKIIDGIESVLKLQEFQTAYSKKVLLERGNMSSAHLGTCFQRPFC